MRRFPSLSLAGSCALVFACGAPEQALPESGEQLVALRQQITGTTSSRFTDTLEEGETASRGPITVFPGQRLQVTLAGRGDADLYVRFGSRPTLDGYDCRPYAGHSNEQCELTVPAGVTSVYVDVRAETASSYSLVLESVPVGAVGKSSKPFVIAVLGSSTAEGEGASNLANSWVGLLGQQLSAMANVSVVNFATGGYSTLDLLPHSGTDGTIRDAIAEDPDLVVISLAGGNDISEGTPAASYVARLSKARSIAQNAGIPTFFVGTAPKNTSDDERLQLGDWNQQMRSGFSSCWTPTNPSYSPCFIDVMADLGNADREIEPSYDSGDGIHLNDEGHQVLFANAADVITQYVCTLSDCR